MIEHGHALSIKRQAQMLSISRASTYYRPKRVSDAEITLMCRVDELHLELPFAGARMLRDLLRGEDVGVPCGKKGVIAPLNSNSNSNATAR